MTLAAQGRKRVSHGASRDSESKTKHQGEAQRAANEQRTSGGWVRNRRKGSVKRPVAAAANQMYTETGPRRQKWHAAVRARAGSADRAGVGRCRRGVSTYGRSGEK